MSEKSLKFLLIGNLLTIFILSGLSFLFHNQFSSFENQIFDTKFQIKKYLKNTIEISSDIIHINIDDYSKSRQQSSEYWSKKNEANLFNKIADENSKIILCDLLYVNNRDTTGNKSLIEAINKCNNVISPFVVKFENKDFSHDDFFEISGLKFNPNSDQKYLNISKIIYKPVDPIIEASYGYGFVNINDGSHLSDITIRKVPLVSKINNIVVPSIIFETFLSYLNYPIENVIFKKNRIEINQIKLKDKVSNISIPIDNEGKMYINFIGQFTTDNYPQSFSAIDYLQKNQQLDLTNKLVVVSDISSSSNDIKQTPFQQMAGSYILSNALNTILSNKFLNYSSFSINIIIFIILLLIIVLATIKTSGIRFLIISMTSLSLFVVISFSFFIYFDIILPIFNILFILTGVLCFSSAYKFAKLEKEKGELEGSLKSYLSPILLKRFKNNPELLKNGGERKNISVMFVDIVGFTKFCDQSEPEEVQLVLSQYLDSFVKIIFKYNGIVDKYLGDGILAFFENNLDKNTSAITSIKCSKELQKEAIKINKNLTKQNIVNFQIRIGIATGYAKVGNLGPNEKVDYTIIGSVVNLSSRLDALGNSGDIIIDDKTHFFSKDEYDIESLGKNKIKGFHEAIEVYKVN